MTAVPLVILVDDDDSYLRASARLLSGAGFRLATYSSGRQLLDAVKPDTRGCIVADLSMPEMDGLQLQSMLADAGVHMPIIFLSGHGDIPTTVRAMRGGAVDFLEKHAPQERLVAAIRHALERDAEAESRHSRQIVLCRRFASLSKRELEVLRELLRGHMNKQIAGTLRISERTVKLHRTSIKTKIGVRSVAQLATLARDAGILET